MTAYSSARPGDPWFIGIHTGEGILDKDDMVRFLDNNPDASAHAAADADGVAYGGVPDERAAWTAGPTGNNWGLHIELCAFAQMTRDQWLSEVDVTIFVPRIGTGGAWRTIRKPRQMLRNAASWARTKAYKFGISIRKVNAAQLRADVDGICGHADTSAAWGETDHTDPGPGFPWDVFLTMVLGTEQKEEEDDMYSDGDRLLAQAMAARVEALAMTVGEAKNGPNGPKDGKPGERLQGPIDVNETKWRVNDLMHLKPKGDKDRVVGETYELVALLKRLDQAATDTAARLDRIEKRIGLGDPNSPIRET